MRKRWVIPLSLVGTSVALPIFTHHEASAETIDSEQSQVSQSQQQDETEFYRIKWGDTLSELGQSTNSDVQTLLQLNPQINNADLIYAGNLLKVPSFSNLNQTSYEYSERYTDNDSSQVHDATLVHGSKDDKASNDNKASGNGSDSESHQSESQDFKRIDFLDNADTNKLEKDVKYYLPNGKNYVLNGKLYDKNGDEVANLSVEDIKKLPFENGVYNASPVKK
ncbi:LysM peptidoglycan-binding domain-containing protein [Staphylococcus hominis]|uniref:LysM peptidoglycan-binding domain-containing protein n=1 Tax=Staphylococcus hominis TaxID=1290 RepID=UPI003DA07540